MYRYCACRAMAWPLRHLNFRIALQEHVSRGIQVVQGVIQDPARDGRCNHWCNPAGFAPVRSRNNMDRWWWGPAASGTLPCGCTHSRTGRACRSGIEATDSYIQRFRRRLLHQSDCSRRVCYFEQITLPATCAPGHEELTAIVPANERKSVESDRPCTI